MKCPICKADLSPLDLVSRTEHVDLCIENGPTIVDIGENGRLVVKKNIPPGKQRKICPICDKTFQTIHSHFKTCALKNDLPPALMLDYWDKINNDTKNPKKFPRDLLDNFVAKSVREGRVGDQVDFARALSLSMATGESNDTTNDPTSLGQTATSTNVQSESMASVPAPGPQSTVASAQAGGVQASIQTNNTTTNATRPKATANKVKYRLELADDLIKQSNIELRVDRELAAARARRYEEALMEQQTSNDVDVILIGDEDEGEIVASCPVSSATHKSQKQDLISTLPDKLFHKARLKGCIDSELCSRGECQDHDFDLLIEGFEVFVGRSIFAPRSETAGNPVQEVEAIPSTSSDCSQGASSSVQHQ